MVQKTLAERQLRLYARIELVSRALGCFLALAVLSHGAEVPGSSDPAFAKIPFDRWIGENKRSRMHWSATVTHPEISYHQRLLSHIEVKVDGKDLEGRRGAGQLVIFAQLTDGSGTRYQDHGVIELNKLDEKIRSAELTYTHGVFLLPGDYRLAVAILDTKSGDHVSKQMSVRVTAAKKEFVPGAWHDLRPVEFLNSQEAPDSWYQPHVEGRLRWELRAGSQISVIMNVGAQKRTGLEALLPTLKVLAQAASDSVAVNIKVLDVHGRRVLLKEQDARTLSWERLRDAVSERNTGVVDIKALGEQHRDAQFFVREVGQTLRNHQGDSCAMVVLTNWFAFNSGEDLQPISLEEKPACQVIFIRYRLAPEVNRSALPIRLGRGRRDGFGEGPQRHPRDGVLLDQLASILKPLSPKVLDVETPEQMSKALEIIAAGLR